VNQSHDDRSPMAIAMELSSRVTTISLEMALPGVLGLLLDNRWGTVPLFTVLGVIVGFGLGMMSLMKLASATPQKGQRGNDSTKSDSESSSDSESNNEEP